MKNRVHIAESVAAAFPEAEIALLYAYGLRNAEPWPDAAAALGELERTVAEETWRPFAPDSPEIAAWHRAYRAFGTNPKRIRPSVEALSRRLARDARLPRINPAVDAYNLVSVRHGLPAGAFDLAAMAGDVDVRHAAEGDAFTPLGEPDVTEAPKPGEVVYAQGSRVLTRHWNHRDADATKVTAASTDVLFILERIDATVPRSRLDGAVEELSALLASRCGELSVTEVAAAR